MNTLDTTLASLKEKGFRKTKLRLAVLELLQEAHKPLSIPELQKLLISKSLTPNKTSLYRELDMLVENTIANRATISGVTKVYIAESGHHHHFVCTTCNDTYCVDDPALEKSLQVIERSLKLKQDLATVRHDLTFYGYCKDCSN